MIVDWKRPTRVIQRNLVHLTARFIPPGVAAAALGHRLSRDDRYLPENNIELLHKIGTRVARLVDDGGSNRWLNFRWLQIYEDINDALKHWFDQNQGFRAAVVGPGTRNPLALPLLLSLRGASHTSMIEPEPVDERDFWKIQWGVQDLVHGMATGRFRPTDLNISLERISDFIQCDNMNRASRWADLLGPNLSWRSGLAEHLLREPDSLDFIMSRSVMEHVKSVSECHRSFHRVLSPSGVMYHDIDFTSHTGTMDPFRFYYEGKPADFGLNGLRLSEFIEQYEALGFAVEVPTQASVPQENVDYERLNDHYDRYDIQDLLITRAVLLVKKE